MVKMEKRKYISLVPYYGGKYYMLPHILEIINNTDRDIYVEPFCGSAKVLLNKQKLKNEIEVINDYDNNIINLFKVLLDDTKREMLINKLAITPYSRQLWAEYKKTYKEGNDVDRALKYVYLLYTSMSSSIAKGSYTITSSKVNTYHNSLIRNNKVSAVVERLKNVVIENRDYKYIITKYDSDNTLYYLDPPYVHKTRKSKDAYICEMTEEQHKELVDILLNVKGKVILSGYESDIYERLKENGWQAIKYNIYKPSTASQKYLDKAEEILYISANIEINNLYNYVENVK